jgi:preprotein translocase subunit SecE
VARDRKRAKQRRSRRGTTAGGRVEAVPPSQPVRADLPAALDHSSADVDEFDAALIRGADGVPVESGNGITEAGAADDELEDIGHDDLLQASGSGSGGIGGSVVAAGEEARPSGAPLREGNRAVAFLRASWAELQRVQWPDRRQVFQATAVVLGFVAIAGAYLGLADYVAKEIVEFIL